MTGSLSCLESKHKFFKERSSSLDLNRIGRVQCPISPMMPCLPMLYLDSNHNDYDAMNAGVVPRPRLLCSCHLCPIRSNACQLFWVGRPGRSYWHFQLLDILWWKHEVCIVHRMRLQDGWFGNMVALLPTWHQIPGAPDHIQTFDLLLPLSWLVQVALLTPHCWQGTSSICWGDLLPGWVTIPSCKHANIKSTVGISWSQVYQTLIQLRFFHFHFSSQTRSPMSFSRHVPPATHSCSRPENRL